MNKLCWTNLAKISYFTNLDFLKYGDFPFPAFGGHFSCEVANMESWRLLGFMKQISLEVQNYLVVEPIQLKQICASQNASSSQVSLQKTYLKSPARKLHYVPSFHLITILPTRSWANMEPLGGQHWYMVTLDNWRMVQVQMCSTKVSDNLEPTQRNKGKDYKIPDIFRWYTAANKRLLENITTIYLHWCLFPNQWMIISL